MSDDIRTDFWKALEHSPFLMVHLVGDHAHSVPMTAQLDKHANHAFWFYTVRDNRLARGGAAMAQFAGKGHDLFACISGTLREESNPEVIDRYWSNAVEAWYDGGRNDPRLLMLRLDLGEAEIWTADVGVKGMFKLMTGRHITPQETGKHAQVAL
ncbi:MAG TPA: pyridoxamine 5'-phosphate oxidase family protein [Sphingobium sp.]|uniref:pyridoxamine 5'-phosphate oxidase family protein n=1 Tax=Sphingobium sp. TaxID=1912891 RepID=UPI002ED26883